MIKIKEIRLVIQHWYETDENKNGWDTNGWQFSDDGRYIEHLGNGWEVYEVLRCDKFGNPIMGLATRQFEV